MCQVSHIFFIYKVGRLVVGGSVIFGAYPSSLLLTTQKKHTVLRSDYFSPDDEDWSCCDPDEE